MVSLILQSLSGRVVLCFFDWRVSGEQQRITLVLGKVVDSWLIPGMGYNYGCQPLTIRGVISPRAAYPRISWGYKATLIGIEPRNIMDMVMGQNLLFLYLRA